MNINLSPSSLIYQAKQLVALGALFLVGWIIVTLMMIVVPSLPSLLRPPDKFEYLLPGLAYVWHVMK